MNKKFISLFALTLLLGLVLVNFTSAVLLTSNLGNFTEGTQFKVKFSFANDYGFAFYDGINLARAEGVCATSARYPLFDTRFDNCPSVCIPFSDPRHVDEFCTIHQREHLVTPATLGIHNIKISDFDFEGSRCQMNSELQVKRP